ncbi:MAG: hypothetical protein ACRC10_01515 [Thermoguttaceae bacterium]
MKFSMLSLVLGVALFATQAFAIDCGPCDQVGPCDSACGCKGQSCDLFAGLKSLLKTRPISFTSCAPCEPVVACNPCDVAAECNPCDVAVNCNPCDVACNPCDVACGHGCFKPSIFHGLFSGFKVLSCNPCDPNGCNPCDVAAECNPCDVAVNCNPCDPCGYNGPGPITTLLVKTHYGVKKLFRGFVGVLDLGCNPCSPCGTVDCNPCDVAVNCNPCDPVCPAPCDSCNSCK